MKVTIQNELLKAVIETKGAELISLQKIATNRDYMWEANPEYWGKSSPILFPIVGRLKKDCYVFEGEKFELPRHGFAREMKFEVQHKTENEVGFTLNYSQETLVKFPFEFELQLKYALVENELVFSYKIINKSSKKMPFCIGAHPAFTLLKEISNYSLLFENQEVLNCYTLTNELLTENYYPIELNDKKLALTESTFINDALIFKTLQSKKVTILEGITPMLSVNYSDFKSLGIWSKVGAPFVCIEPWLGYADTIDTNGNLVDKEGILILQSQKEYNCEFSVQIY